MVSAPKLPLEKMPLKGTFTQIVQCCLFLSLYRQLLFHSRLWLACSSAGAPSSVGELHVACSSPRQPWSAVLSAHFKGESLPGQFNRGSFPRTDCSPAASRCCHLLIQSSLESFPEAGVARDWTLRSSRPRPLCVRNALQLVSLGNVVTPPSPAALSRCRSRGFPQTRRQVT